MNAPTILPPQVRVPSTPSTLLSFIVFAQYLSYEKNENSQEEVGFGPFFLKKTRCFTFSCDSFSVNLCRVEIQNLAFWCHEVVGSQVSQQMFLNRAIHELFFLYFQYSLTVKNVLHNNSPMTGLKPRTFGVRRNCTANWATTITKFHSKLLACCAQSKQNTFK